MNPVAGWGCYGGKSRRQFPSILHYPLESVVRAWRFRRTFTDGALVEIMPIPALCCPTGPLRRNNGKGRQVNHLRKARGRGIFPQTHIWQVCRWIPGQVFSRSHLCTLDSTESPISWRDSHATLIRGRRLTKAATNVGPTLRKTTRKTHYLDKELLPTIRTQSRPITSACWIVAHGCCRKDAGEATFHHKSRRQVRTCSLSARPATCHRPYRRADL